MKMKIVVAAAATLASSSAFAGATANVGGVSEYMFRGLSQGSGAAIQGGLDYAHDSGFYVGTWASNVDWGVGSTELDVYGGFTGSFGEGFGFDVGAIYYYYPEVDEENEDLEPDTIEAYAGITAGPVGLKVFYSPDYFGATSGDDDEIGNIYVAGSLGLPISESLKFVAGVGYSVADEEIYADGDELSDDYVDYNVGLSKAVDETITATFALIGTTLEDDDIKPVIGLKKVFDL